MGRNENFPQRPVMSFSSVNRMDLRSRTSAPNGFTFRYERTECIYVPENTGKLAEYRKCKAANPGKKGPEIIECLKEWVKSDFVEE